MLAAAPMLQAATVTFDIVPADADPNQVVKTNDMVITPIPDSNDFEMRVLPKARIPFEVFATVTSDTPNAPDNAGLSFFSVALASNLGIAQQPVDAFAPGIGTTFPVSQSLGAPVGDDILQISGGQQSINPVFSVAGNQRTMLFEGTLLVPEVNLGVFSVEVNDLTSSANVFRESGVATSAGARVVSGQRIVIRTTLDPGTVDDNNGGDSSDGGGTDGNGSGTDGGTNGGTDGTNGGTDGGSGGQDGGPGTMLPTIPPTTAIVMAAGMLVAIGLATLAAGPFGAMVMLVVAPVVALLAAMLGSA